MNLFYTADIVDGLAILPEEEARHCVQVLRKRVGDPLSIVDGRGGFYTTVIEKIGKNKCNARVKSCKLAFNKTDYKLHIAIAPTKSISRFEWFLEKATEIEIDEITPILCQRSERKSIRPDRLQKILVSAMKQSVKAYLPSLNELISFPEFLAKMRSSSEAKFIGYCSEGANVHLRECYEAGQNACILIGPEGDFSEEEIILAKDMDFRGTSLGKSRLRTETAGVVACSIISLLNA